MPKRILDIGAGAHPIRGATHAIDIAPEEEIQDELEETGRRLPKGIHYTFSHDFIRKTLPYPSNFFDQVVSRFALGMFGLTAKPWREAQRVLKPGGTLTIDLGDINKEKLERIRTLGKSTGFSSGKLVDLGNEEIRVVLRK